VEDAELIKKMLSGLSQEETTNRETTELLDEMNEKRVVALRDAITEIQEQIKFRQKLHEEMMKNLEELKSSINNMIPSIPHPTFEFQKFMVEMRKKLVEADEMKVKEKLDCFRDIAQLKKELREWLREFTEKEKSASFLGELLSKE
jgi:hypothetical protein